MKQKAQVSLEFILLSLAVITILSIIITQATILYSKNIDVIDNRELKNTSEKIQSIINIVELLENYKDEIYIYPQKDWKFIKIDDFSFKIENKDKEYIIESNDKIYLYLDEIFKSEKIIIKKQENKIYIEQK